MKNGVKEGTDDCTFQQHGTLSRSAEIRKPHPIIPAMLAATPTTALTAIQRFDPPSGNRANPAIPQVASATSVT
jgi:hypothetical protein